MDQMPPHACEAISENSPHGPLLGRSTLRAVAIGASLSDALKAGLLGMKWPISKAGTEPALDTSPENGRAASLTAILVNPSSL